jgi:hypothetical protein
MATTAQNNITRTVAQKSYFDDMSNQISSASTWNQGDLIFLDTTAHLLKVVTGAITDGDTFMGVSRVSIVSGNLPSPYQGTAVDASEKVSALPGPVVGVVAKFKLKSGDAFTVGCKVYTSAVDAQTVSVTANGGYIGLYQGKALTASATSVGEVMLSSIY